MTSFQEIRNLFNITENEGFTAEEIGVYKNVVDSIPKVLHEYYFQLGKNEKLNQTQDMLLEPSKLVLSKDGNYLIFYAENQWVCCWGISLNDVYTEDPAVYMSYDELEWSKETDTLSDFLKAMAHLQAMFALAHCSGEFAYITLEDVQSIEENFQKKNFSFSSWIGIDFYGNHDTDVIVVQRNDDNFDLTYASSMAENFENMKEVLGTLGQ